MKKLKLWIKHFSLSQQLLSLVAIVTVTFTLFFFMFLPRNIDFFVKNELFKLLHTSQNNFVFYFNGANQGVDTTDNSIVHILYYPDLKPVVIGRNNLDATTLQIIEKSLQNYDGTVSDYVYETNKVEFLYVIKPLSNNLMIVSILGSSYIEDFRNTLLSSVIQINVLVILALLLILGLWISSVITPLNAIKNYINKVKHNEPSHLSVDRDDEIGEVATAVIDMTNEIEHQNRMKEEIIQNISHDLKTPITAIKSYAESIKDGIYPYQTLEASCDVIIEHASRLEKKAHSLIMLNKMGYLNDSEPGDHLKMKPLIEKVVLSLKLVNPSIEIIMDLMDVKFHGEEEPWRIVVENLFENALRYAKSKIIITLKEQMLCIENDGKNIAKSHIERLFMPYEKGSDGQFGLGLSIVYRVVTTYHYLIRAENLQTGVIFRIYKDDDTLLRNGNHFQEIDVKEANIEKRKGDI